MARATVTRKAPPSARTGRQLGTKLERFMSTARSRFRVSALAERDSRAEQLEDRKFRASQQWHEEDIAEREREDRPHLTINRIPQFINQVINQARAAKPGIAVVPRSGGATLEVAEIIQGYIRDIELKSDADIAYMTAAESQAEIGLGFIKVITEFNDDPNEGDLFAQDIRIKRVRNRFSVYLDPAFQDFDGRDLRWAFQVEDLSREDYEDRWGDEASSLEEFRSIGDDMPLWLPDGGVRIAHYWYVDEETEPLLLLKMPDGTRKGVKAKSVNIDKLKQAGAEVLSSRTMVRRIVRNCVIDGLRILEGADAEDSSRGELWPSKYIPIVPVIGAQIDIEGKVDYRGMVRDAKDPQRAYNYWVTAGTEMVALAPKAPWVMAEGQDEGYERQWKNANRKNYSRLVYTPVTLDGQLAPPPRRETSEPPIMAISGMVKQSDNDLKATMGFYDPSLGERRGEQSGKAILALQKQGEIGNSQYLDNWSLAIRQVGRIVVDLIPTHFQSARLIRTVAEDGSTEMVQHIPDYDGERPDWVPADVDKVVDLTRGVYDITISVGPSFKSKREEAVATLGELLSKNAQLAMILGDLWVGNMDAPWAKEAAERIKRAIPAHLLGDDGEGGEAAIPPAAAQQMQQLQQQLQQMLQQMQELQGENQQLQQKLQSKVIDVDARKQIEELKAANERLLTQMRIESDERIKKLELAVKHAAGAQPAAAPAPRPDRPLRPRRPAQMPSVPR